jgi:Skp family chaperone for outer membrane proteins
MSSNNNISKVRTRVVDNLEKLKKDVYGFINAASTSKKNKLTHNRKRTLRTKGARINVEFEKKKNEYHKKYNIDKRVVETSMGKLQAYRKAIDLLNQLQKMLDKERDNLLRTRTVNTTFQKKLSDLLFAIKTPAKMVCKAGKCVRRKVR